MLIAQINDDGDTTRVTNKHHRTNVSAASFPWYQRDDLTIRNDIRYTMNI